VKALHKLILGYFLPPFIATFLVTWFVFAMQFFWLYIDDLVGKGLDTSIILKLILYLAPTLVPFALPLSVLLASIMMFGKIAESSELTAMKSGGNSLLKISHPILVLSLFISCLAFLFNNYVIPVANLKFQTLLMDIRNTKPAVKIQAGSFYNDLPGYSIYVSRKEKDNQTIQDVMIYDHTSGKGNDKVILAKKGKMYVTADNKFLIFELSNGCRYEEKQGKTNNDKEQVRLQFKFWKKIFDLSAFELKKTQDDYLKSNNDMLNNKELQLKMDTVQIRIKDYTKQNKESTQAYISLLKPDSIFTFRKKNVAIRYKKQLSDLFADTTKQKIFSNVSSSTRSLKSLSEIYKSDYDIQVRNANQLRIAWHLKLTLALSCLVLFILGAPLGALIKKGGFGMPFVVAVLFFVLYRILTEIGRKVAEEGKISVVMGMWGPLIILLVIGLFLFYKANKDEKVGTKSKQFLSKFFNKIFKPKKSVTL
jgi:lipopolysaccharide export system permease protein